jgi:integrase
MASIRKRTDRKSTRWIVDCRDVPGGRRLTVKTKEEAELERSKMVQEGQQAQLAVVDPDVTLGAFADRWLTQVEHNLQPRTLASYADTLRLHIRPTLGASQVRALHRGHIKALLAVKRAAGLSQNSVRLIRATLSVLLSDAIDEGLIKANPASGLHRRGRKGADSTPPADMQEKVKAMSHAQLAGCLLVAAERLPKATATEMLVMADAGLRPGEACGLQWLDIDEALQTVKVSRAIENSGRVKTTKTGRARSVDVSRRLIAALASLQAQGEAEALTSGREPSAWCFPTRDGTPTRPDWLGKQFGVLARRAGLSRDFTAYSLRHTYASHLIAANAPITYVSSMLGHRSTTTTLAFYAHLFPNNDRRFAEQIEAQRLAALPAPVPAVAPDDAPWPRFGPARPESAPHDSQVMEKTGAGGGSRTRDLLITNQLLCH